MCSWNHPILPTDDYYIDGYTLSYRLADGFDYYPGYGTTLNTISIDSETQQYLIEGLRPYAGYNIQLECVIFRDIMGSGELSMFDDQYDNITSYASLSNITQPSGTI